MPPAGIATKPRRMDLSGELFCSCEPVPVDVEPFLQVDVEKMISCRPACSSPAADALIQSALEVSAILIEMNESRIVLFHPTSINALGGDIKLARNSDSQSGQMLYSFRKHCHGSDCTEFRASSHTSSRRAFLEGSGFEKFLDLFPFGLRKIQPEQGCSRGRDVDHSRQRHLCAFACPFPINNQRGAHLRAGREIAVRPSITLPRIVHFRTGQSLVE